MDKTITQFFDNYTKTINDLVAQTGLADNEATKQAKAFGSLLSDLPVQLKPALPQTEQWTINNSVLEAIANNFPQLKYEALTCADELVVLPHQRRARAMLEIIRAPRD